MAKMTASAQMFKLDVNGKLLVTTWDRTFRIGRVSFRFMESYLHSIKPLSATAPVAIGGVGGSGTRVVAHLLRELGFDIGHDLNESLDDLCFTALFKRQALWLPEEHAEELQESLEAFLSARNQLVPSGTTELEHRQRAEVMIEKLLAEDAWQEHGTASERLPALQQVGTDKAYWGWKEPNTHIFLPYLLRALPNMKYIHVIRSGLDMAFSANQAQLALWGEALLDRPVDPTSPEDSFSYWCAAHDRLLSFLPFARERMFLLRFESLLMQPDLVLREVARFLSLDINDQVRARWQGALRVPTPLGRHSEQPPINIEQDQSKLLAQFGYSI